MSSSGNGDISFSFACLQTLMKSFRDVAEGEVLGSLKRDAICELVDHLGEVAIPVLLRNLFGPPDTGQWASELLLHLSRVSSAKARIRTELGSYENASNLNSSSLLRVADLIATLDGWQEELPTNLSNEGIDTEDYSEQYLATLAGCIHSKADVAHIANLLLRDFAPGDLPDFIERMALNQPGCAKALVQELILRDDLERQHRQSLRGVAASLSEVLFEIPLSLRERSTMTLATHASGASSIVSYIQIPPADDFSFGGKEQEEYLYRALQLNIDTRQGLTGGQYLTGIDRSAIDSRAVHPLVESGFELRPISQSEVEKRLTIALRACSRRGQSIPNCYYLGRDIVGLHDEHILPGADAECDSAALFSRGNQLMTRGKYQQARTLLEKYAKQHPNDPEAMSALASCHIELQNPDSARYYLEQASSLAPAVGRYHWNRASLAHREGRLGECFLAFQEYLLCGDARDQKQIALANQFIRQYTRSKAEKKTPAAPNSVFRAKP